MWKLSNNKCIHYLVGGFSNTTKSCEMGAHGSVGLMHGCKTKQNKTPILMYSLWPPMFMCFASVDSLNTHTKYVDVSYFNKRF
jgi:hypothetical protein